jgi:hypothetical protein
MACLQSAPAEASDACTLTSMARHTWRDFGPDVEVIRDQMALQPPDDGSIVVESDGEKVTGISWTHKGERCSVSTPILTPLPD